MSLKQTLSVIRETKQPARGEIGAIVETFRKWLYLPDETPLLAVMGAVAANLLEGDPVWLLLVGPPGGGKSELLGSVVGLPDVHAAATLTEAALLSGSPKREHVEDAKGGLLRSIGDFGIVVCKDFGSVLSMNRDARAAVLAALREVYDGSWTRHVGTDGGRTLSWAGKVGLVAGCTPTIDRHHAVMGAMGERFILFRLPEVDGSEQARRALAHAGRERKMREELAAGVGRLFSSGLATPAALSESDAERLIALTTLVVRARSAVERDGYSREVEPIPESEAPTRLVVVLARLLAGLDSIGVPRDAGWRVVLKAGLDSIPAIRRDVMNVLHGADALETSKVGEAVSYPTTTTRRALEELEAHGIADRRTGGQGTAHMWSLSGFARQQLAAATTVPETSEVSITSPLRVFDDKSGKVSGEPPR